MTDPLDHQARVLLTTADQAVAGDELVVKSVTAEYFARAGKLLPRVTIVLEPPG